MISMNRKKVLLLGASGLIGKPLFRRLGTERAMGIYCKKSIENGVFFDSTRMGLEEILKSPQDFSHAVLLLGESDPQKCPNNPETTDDLNVRSMNRLILALERYAIKPIFLSSEYVFDGEKGFYMEDMDTRPIILYGHQKLAIEKFLEEICKDFVILRISKVVTSELEDGRLFSTWLKAFEGSKMIRCASDQVFSPTFLDDTVEAIMRVIDQNVSGIFHISGPEPYNRIDLLKMFIRKIQTVENFDIKIQPCSINDFGLTERMPLDVSMSPEKSIRLLGLKLTNMDMVCDQIVRKKLLLQNQREEVKG